MTVDGILAVPEPTVKAFHLSTALGKGMRKDGTFAPLRDPDDLLAVAVWEIHRDRVIALLGLSSQAWRRYVRQWETVGMAHRCRHLARGRVFLFLNPETLCRVCGEAFTTRTVERSSGERSAFMARTQNVLTAGDASRDEEGDRSSASESLSQEGSSEIAPPSDEEALANLKRILGASPMGACSMRGTGDIPTGDDLLTSVSKSQADVDAVPVTDVTPVPIETSEIGDPLTDKEIRELGYEPTRKGWIPRKAASDAA